MAYKQISPQSVSEGGTGASTLTDHGVLIGSGTSAVSVTSVGTNGQVLTSNGAGSDPTFQDSPTSASGALVQEVYEATSTTTDISSASIPLDNTIPQQSEGTQVLSATITPTSSTNKLEIDVIVNLGSKFTSSIALFQDSTANAIAAFGRNYTYSSPQSSLDQYIIKYQMTAGTTSATTFKVRAGPRDTNSTECILNGVAPSGTVTSYFGGVLRSSITIKEIGTSTVSPNSFTWVEKTANDDIEAGYGYIANKSGLLTMTLPTTASVGDVFAIINTNTAVGWRVAQNASQYIMIGDTATTTGATGYLEATALGDSIECVCIAANNGWYVRNSSGNITVN